MNISEFSSILKMQEFPVQISNRRNIKSLTGEHDPKIKNSRVEH